MSDVQVSNARRIGFTALAVVAFWVLSWRAYTISMGLAYGSEFLLWVVTAVHEREWREFVFAHKRVIAGLVLAPVPTLLLWISRSGGRRWVLSCGLLFALSIAFVFWRAEADSDGIVWIGFDTLELHTVSWLWLLTPITLTTAFVIFGAWRRAVRDAEVEAVGGDPDGHRSPA